MSSGLHPDRLFPATPAIRDIARELYQHVRGLPIISPHGHTDPHWFAENAPFDNATSLLIQPDHYVFRMLYSQGIALEDLGIGQPNLGLEQASVIWRRFAEHYYLFRGTACKMWLDYVFYNVFELDRPLNSSSADYYFEQINRQLNSEAFRPRQLFERFNIEFLATTEGALDPLEHHQSINQSDWQGRVVTTFRPDTLTDPAQPQFHQHLEQLAETTRQSISTFNGFLQALGDRRTFFKSMGATATDHSHPSAATADLSKDDKERLYQKVKAGQFSAHEAELFRAQMMTEMAQMSIDDGLVMQLHHGCFRNHNASIFEKFGRDKGADVPMQCEFVKALQPMLSKLGNHPGLSIILFTLDETTYSRELAPLAGHYPSLKLGPAWWFHDSPEGMRRYRQQTMETAGFYNTVGFNDDTRAFLSIPARHDLARRMDCAWLAELVADHRLTEDEAQELAIDLSYRLAKHAYKV